MQLDGLITRSQNVEHFRHSFAAVFRAMRAMRELYGSARTVACRATRASGMLAAVTEHTVRERAPEQESTPQQRALGTPALAPAREVLLSLQRTAGNAAVGRLLARTPQSDTVTAMK